MGRRAARRRGAPPPRGAPPAGYGKGRCLHPHASPRPAPPGRRPSAGLGWWRRGGCRVSQQLPSVPSLPAGVKILNGERAGLVVYPLQAETSFGRMSSVNVFLPDLKCSRNHMLILWDRGRWILMDLSSNGTWLNGQRVPRATDVELNSGDVVRIGDTELEFRTSAAPQPGARTGPPPPPAQAAPPAPSPPPPAHASATPEPPAEPAAAPPVEYVFDFSEDSGTTLDKVFDYEKDDKWTSTQTQAFDATELRKGLRGGEP
ncbi:MAG: FHA domain-containing protein [Planctomycetota bacterium]|nr:MAG: FHA domain-containing protein [Planctomycetota bacterium]